MNPELAMARCRLEDLKLRAREISMEIDDCAGALREAVAPYVPKGDINAERVVFLSAKLVGLLIGQDGRPGLRDLEAEAARLREAYSL